MELRKHHITRIVSSLGVAAVIAAQAAAPAFAADTAPVSQGLIGGELTVTSTTDPAFGAKNYSHAAQDSDSTTNLALSIDDSRGLIGGWSVTILSSDLTSGSNTIGAAQVSIGGLNAPTRAAGQAVDPLGVGGPKIPATNPDGTALNTAKKFVTALVGFGKGTYAQSMGFRISIPAGQSVGTYTGTLTLTESSSP